MTEMKSWLIDALHGRAGADVETMKYSDEYLNVVFPNGFAFDIKITDVTAYYHSMGRVVSDDATGQRKRA